MPQNSVAGITTVPSPVGGVDFYSNLFGMPPENAIRLTNWWPDVYGCTHRLGYVVWSDAMPAQVQSLFAYRTRTNQSFLYAIAGGKLYDITSKDTVSPPPARTAKVSGLVTSIWQGAPFSNASGTHTILVSGQDNPIWIHQTAPPAVVFDRITFGTGAGQISGFDPKNAVDITIHQRRVWMVEKNTTYGWFNSQPDLITGTYSLFDFGPLLKRGGYLQSLATWTVDDGDGSDDMLVAFGSEGDVVVYKGVNPGANPITNPGEWTLQGVYYAGSLLKGNRFHTKVSGDLKFLTQQGLVGMNDMLTSSRVVAPQNNVEANPVQQFLAEQASTYGFLDGWDFKFVPAINMLIINIPSVVDGGALQVCENVVNSKWTTFLGLDASCWCADYGGVPFFGSGTQVCQGWTGHTDKVTINAPAGVPITAIVQQAYNYFGTPANNKRVGIYRPNFLTDRSVVFKSFISYDFGFRFPTVQALTPISQFSSWDSAIWDAAIWTGGLHAQKQWVSAEGCGFAGSLSMASRSDGEVVWPNTDMTVSSGGIL
jgi:hypothetical protein